MRARARGFTLLELVVGLSVALLVFAAATEVLLHVETTRRLATAQARLQRDAGLAIDWLRRDLYAAGAGGTASDKRLDAPAPAAGTFARIWPPLMEMDAARDNPTGAVLTPGNGANTKFVILTDVARPDTNYDGLSLVGDRDVPADKLIAINELSGRCDSSNAVCSSREGALRSGLDCANTADPACPWAQRKYLAAGNAIAGATTVQVFHPDNSYENAQLSGAAAGNPNVMNLAAPLLQSANRPVPTGRITQLDRVGWRLNPVTSTLERRQCWGRVRPDEPGFAAFESTPADCTIDHNDTGWMVMARNVVMDDSRFEFYDADNLITAVPADVRAVRVVLHLKTPVKLGAATKWMDLRIAERFVMRVLI